MSRNRMSAMSWVARSTAVRSCPRRDSDGAVWCAGQASSPESLKGLTVEQTFERCILPGRQKGIYDRTRGSSASRRAQRLIGRYGELMKRDDLGYQVAQSAKRMWWSFCSNGWIFLVEVIGMLISLQVLRFTRQTCKSCMNCKTAARRQCVGDEHEQKP
jgi:hypothetical protein